LTQRKEKAYNIPKKGAGRMEKMGMTDNQYKDFIEGIKEDLEELNEYKEAGDSMRYVL